MENKRKNESQVDIDLFTFLSTTKRFDKKWTSKKVSNKYIQNILDHSSKASTGKRGEPDLIYLNENNKLLILIENKDSIKDHQSSNKDKPKNYAVDGIIHYLSFFVQKKLLKFKLENNYLNGWNIVGIAFSGNIHDEYNHAISTFIIQDDKIIDTKVKEFLNEREYLAYFRNIDLEVITKNISQSSAEINRKLRSIDSQKRPVLLSALMICLYDNEDLINNFKTDYVRWTTKNIIRSIPTTIQDVLSSESISFDKIEVLINELAFIKIDKHLSDSEILKDILDELTNSVIPLFDLNSNYDIIGKFYEEFLRYAGVANVKKGIVLTPAHITELFVNLIPLKINDVILDTCCGTGSFLITGMNAIIKTIKQSSIANKKERISNVKSKQLIGFELSTTMYSLAISNMLFRGDGKSQIYNIDTFSESASQLLNKLSTEGIKPTIGFINPPYGGKGNTKNPTKKEIQFVEQLLDIASRFVVVIAPVSTYFKDAEIRNRIFSKHTLKYVINMPKELFQPNASTHTAIAVFETQNPHLDKEVILYNMSEDGFVLSKGRGRTDVFNKWSTFKHTLLNTLKEPNKYCDRINCIKLPIKKNDEWILEAHCDTNYNLINNLLFEKAILQFKIFDAKLKMGVLGSAIDEIMLLDIFDNYIEKNENITSINLTPKLITNWKSFKYSEVFDIRKGKRLTKVDLEEGDTPFIAATEFNNGYRQLVSASPIHPGNTITVNYNGSVGKAFYQPAPYFCSDDVNVLYPKFDLDITIAMFLIPMIEVERFRYGFGRKWNSNRMIDSLIKLPVDKKEAIDFNFMRRFIGKLRYKI